MRSLTLKRDQTAKCSNKVFAPPSRRAPQCGYTFGREMQAHGPQVCFFLNSVCSTRTPAPFSGSARNARKLDSWTWFRRRIRRQGQLVQGTNTKYILRFFVVQRAGTEANHEGSLWTHVCAEQISEFIHMPQSRFDYYLHQR